MYKWEKSFSRIILDRGKDYADRKRVTIISMNNQNAVATVRGSRQYSVCVRLSDAGDFIGGSCDCPYAEDNSRCKHMAAVLYTMEEKRGTLERAMEDFESLIAATDNSDTEFFNKLSNLLLKYLMSMTTEDAEKFALTALRAMMSRQNLSARMTNNPRHFCVVILSQSAAANIKAQTRIRDELLSMLSDAENPNAVEFITRTTLDSLSDKVTYNTFMNALINKVPDSLNPEDAPEILLHSCGSNQPEIINEVYERLMDRCRETGTNDRLIDGIKNQLSVPYQFNCTLALILKGFTPEDEWPEVYDEILSAGNMCSEKYAFMFLENDYDRLMDSIEQYDTYGYNFEKYEKELKKALPGRALVYRVSVAERALAAAKNKYDYREAVKLLKKASSYPDGKEMVAAAAKFWRENNPRKTSLLEALDRAKL